MFKTFFDFLLALFVLSLSSLALISNIYAGVDQNLDNNIDTAAQDLKTVPTQVINLPQEESTSLAMINIIFNDRSLTPEAKIKFLAQGLEQESSANEFCLKLKAKLTNLFGLNPRIFHAQFFNKEAISVSEILSVTRNTFTSNQEKAFSDKLATQLSQILFDQFNSLIQTAQNLAGENPDYYYGLNILAQNMIFLTSALDTQAKLKNLPNLMITTETGAKNLIQAMEERISFVESKARELGFNLVNLKPILLALNGPSSMQKMSQLEKELDLFRGKSLLELNEMVLPTHDLSRVQFKY